MKVKNVKRDDKATGPNTKLAEQIIDATELPANARVIVIVTTTSDDGTRGTGGMAFTGYDDGDDGQVIVDLLVHMKAVANANGLDVGVVEVKGGKS